MRNNNYRYRAMLAQAAAEAAKDPRDASAWKIFTTKTARHKAIRPRTSLLFVLYIFVSSCLGGDISLKHKLRLTEQIEQQLTRIDVHVIGRAELGEIRRTIRIGRRVDITKSSSGLQSRSPESQRDVIDQ